MTTKIKRKTSKKPKKNYLKNEPEVFWYLNAKGDKLWGFRHRYYDALGNRREKPKQGLATETIAIRELLKVKTDLINGNVKRVDNSNITVSEWMDIWFEANRINWGIKTLLQREEVIENKIKPMLGRYRLADLTLSTYRKEYINKLLKTHAPGSVKIYHLTVSVAINAAVDDEIIAKNRFNKIKIKVGKRKDNYLTPKELNHFLDISKKMVNITYHSLFFLLAYTGLRKGEALGLKWKNIDFQSRTLTVERTRDHYGVRVPKTARSYRTIPIDEELITILKAYRKWCKKTKFTFGKHLKDDDFIFISTIADAPISVSFQHPFQKILNESGVNIITPHGLRHTHASILIMKRPVNEVADRLGNTPEMIHKVYGHLMDEMKIKSVTAFSESMKNVDSGGTFGG